MDASLSPKMQRMLIDRSLKPLKDMVEIQGISGESILRTMKDQFGFFSDKNHSPGYARFKANSSLIYQGEPDIQVSYRLPPGDEYLFGRASFSYTHIMFKLHNILSGKDYQSPEELRDLMMRAVKGKRILEIGCGPGFNLEVLEGLGAKVVGVDVESSVTRKIRGLDVRVGDARNLKQVLGNSRFDIIYSKDFMCESILDKDDAEKVLYQTAQHTVPGGLGIHQITYEEIPLPVYLFGFWLRNREMGRDTEGLENFIWSLSKEERRKACQTNHPSIDEECAKKAGFKVKERSEENGDLTFVLKKT